MGIYLLPIIIEIYGEGWGKLDLPMREIKLWEVMIGRKIENQ